MEAPRLISWHDAWASPYATTLYLLGDEQLLDLLSGYNGPELIEGVAIEAAKDGNNVYWKLSHGGDWVLVKTPGSLHLEKFPGERYPVDGMKYLPLHPGERFEGTMGHGKNRSYSVYSAVLTEEGVALKPTNRGDWGDRAYDITRSGLDDEPVAYEFKSEPTNEEDGEGPMADALRKLGLA